MITRQLRINADGKLDAKRLADLAGISPQLVLIFGDPAFFAEPSRALAFRAAFPGSVIAGCSGDGYVSDAGVDDGGAVLTAVRFEGGARVRACAEPVPTMADSADTGARLGRALADGGGPLKTVMVFGPGNRVDASAVTSAVQEAVGRETLVIGGLAGDHGSFGSTWTLLDGEVADRRFVAVGIEGDSVRAHFGAACGWDSFGLVRKVTLAAGNVLFRLDGRPALDVYADYLGDLAQHLPFAALHLPLAVLTESQEDTGLVRSVIGVEPSDGSVILSGAIPENGLVRLMHAKKGKLIEAARLSSSLSLQAQLPGLDSTGTGPSLALVASCVGRRLALGDEVVGETDVVRAIFRDAAVVTGFYGYAQFGPQFDVGDVAVHNQNICVVYIDE